jgi:hypothetical protein
MKEFFILLYFTLIVSSLTAQKCLDLHITPMMSGLNLPGTCANSFGACSIKTNDHGQTQITGYGSDLDHLDTMITRNMRDFTIASITNPNSQTSSPQNAEQAKQLADKLKSMTPEQQKQWAMQMAAQNQQAYANANAVHDDAATSRLILQTNDLAVNQLSALNREFAAKIRDITDASSKEVSAVRSPDKSTCAATKPVGLPTCKCANDLESKYWQQIISIKDKYNNQRVVLLQNYLPKIKAITTTVDYNIGKLNYGDAVKTPQLKKMLCSAQSSAFANAFAIALTAIEDIRKDGSNTYIHKVNADKYVEDLSCNK